VYIPDGCNPPLLQKKYCHHTFLQPPIHQELLLKHLRVSKVMQDFPCVVLPRQTDNMLCFH
jgi:hypothetical protein